MDLSVLIHLVKTPLLESKPVRMTVLATVSADYITESQNLQSLSTKGELITVYLLFIVDFQFVVV